MLVDGVACKLKYRFEPGHALDGVTLQLPLYLLNRIEAGAGRLAGARPHPRKAHRTAEIAAEGQAPPADSAARCGDGISLSVAQAGRADSDRRAGGLIRKKTGTDIHPDDWAGELPPHLQMNFSVIDDSGQELASGRDLAALRQQLGGAARITYGGGAEDSEFERTGLTEWNFGDLPEQVKFKRGGRELIGYPALVEMRRDASTCACSMRPTSAGRKPGAAWCGCCGSRWSPSSSSSTRTWRAKPRWR